MIKIKNKKATAYYVDNDGDKFTPNLSSRINSGFLTSTNYSYSIFTTLTDCNDFNSSISPAAAEICNNVDDNCNNLIDDGFPLYTFYNDYDHDGFGSPFPPVYYCSNSPPFYAVKNNTDCNDNNSKIFPGNTEICNLVDDNCNNLVISIFFIFIFIFLFIIFYLNPPTK